ncbi:MAG TPA: ABC transporter substrate-binding protein, partial [Acidimicrobiales bacterium]|nr:ABC transporter substrate-binding protein [Acidimicrobiales bacterium]
MPIRRLPTIAVLVAALALLASACGDSDPDDESSGRDATTTTEPAVRGGTLVAAIDSDPGALNPAATTSGGTHTASELMFNGLVELDEKGQPAAELAESWEIEDGGATYRFTLRDGVTWHDGQPFTSADVKYTFDEVLLKLHARTKASVAPALEAIEAPDNTTVVFRFKQPYGPFLQQLDVTEAPIIPKHLYEGTDPLTNPANQAPVGTGPFKFEAYTKGSEVRMVANPDYFKEGLPYLDGVVMRIIPDKASQVTALEAGEVDWLFSAPGPDLSRLKAGDYGTLQTGINPGGSNCIMTVSFNLDRPLLKDVETRKGIAQAVDREKFVERVLFGEGKVAAAPISSGIPFAHGKNLDMPDFDKAAAEKTLDGAGWKRAGSGVRSSSGVDGVPDGTPLSFSFTHFPTFNQYAELLVAQLAEVGVEVKSQPLEPPVFADTVFTKRDFDTNVISYCNGPDPEIGVRRMYTTANIGPVAFSNAAAYRNEKVDALFDTAQTSVERADRTKAYQEIQEIVVEELPYFWLV